MTEVTFLSPLASAMAGAYVAAVLEHATAARVGGRAVLRAPLEPIRSAAVMLRQETVTTERPDFLLWSLAPAAYAAAAAGALAVVPLAPRVAIADVRTGIVLFGAAEALAIVAIFLHGWSANSLPALIGGFRFVAVGLSYELLSMFVLIAAALPAESLQVSAIVEAIVRGTATWETDPDFGYQVATSVPGMEDFELLRPVLLYERQGRGEEYRDLVEQLKSERAAYLAGYPALDDSVTAGLYG